MLLTTAEILPGSDIPAYKLLYYTNFIPVSPVFYSGLQSFLILAAFHPLMYAELAW